jgi:hypothetical protein
VLLERSIDVIGSADCYTNTAGWREQILRTRSGHDDLQCCELVGTKAQEDKLQDALKRDVTNREEHDASRNTLRKRRPFYANRIKAPYRVDSRCAHQLRSRSDWVGQVTLRTQLATWQEYPARTTNRLAPNGVCSKSRAFESRRRLQVQRASVSATRCRN